MVVRATGGFGTMRRPTFDAGARIASQRPAGVVTRPMTINPRVNPKKLRPYDEPPRRPRERLPSAPDSAATWFMVGAVAWLALALGLGSLAALMRFLPFELSFGLGVFDLGFTFNQARVEQAFDNALVYGWLSNAGFAATAYMTPRLMGRRLAAEKGLFVAFLVWNASALAGLAALYVFDPGPNTALTAFPWLIDGGLSLAALIVTGSFLATVGRHVRSVFVGLWFVGIGLLSLLGLTALNAATGLLDLLIGLPPLAIALGALFIERALVLLWLLPMAYAALLYVVPRVADRPLESSGLARLAWAVWFVSAPLASLATAVDTAVPYFITSLAGAATMVLLLPAALVVANLLFTARGQWRLLFGTGPAAFGAVALAFILGAEMLDAIGTLRSVRTFVGDTDWASGVAAWMLVGGFGLAALGLLEHALPRVLRRDWGHSLLSIAQLWCIFAGATIAGIGLMGGGMAEGAFRAQAAAPDVVAAGLVGYQLVAFAGIGLAALGGLAALVNLFVAYTTADPAEYAIPGRAATAAAGH